MGVCGRFDLFQTARWVVIRRTRSPCVDVGSWSSFLVAVMVVRRVVGKSQRCFYQQLHRSIRQSPLHLLRVSESIDPSSPHGARESLIFLGSPSFRPQKNAGKKLKNPRRKGLKT